jgi:hypothetical protein
MRPGADGQEIPLFDPKRRPSEWTRVILPHQCAVFLSNTALRLSVGRDLKPQARESATCVLFDSIDDAEAFCRLLVSARPEIGCEILDHEGPVNPPLMHIARAHKGGDDDARGWLSRRRPWIIGCLIFAAIPLFCYDSTHDSTLVLTIIGINLIVAALRLLLWDLAAKSNERERMARLAAHRERERQAPLPEAPPRAY